MEPPDLHWLIETVFSVTAGAPWRTFGGPPLDPWGLSGVLWGYWALSWERWSGSGVERDGKGSVATCVPGLPCSAFREGYSFCTQHVFSTGSPPLVVAVAAAVALSMVAAAASVVKACKGMRRRWARASLQFSPLRRPARLAEGSLYASA